MDNHSAQQLAQDWTATNERAAAYLEEIARQLRLLDEAYAESVADEHIATLTAAARLVEADRNGVK